MANIALKYIFFIDEQCAYNDKNKIKITFHYKKVNMFSTKIESSQMPKLSLFLMSGTKYSKFLLLNYFYCGKFKLLSLDNFSIRLVINTYGQTTLMSLVTMFRQGHF